MTDPLAPRIKRISFTPTFSSPAGSWSLRSIGKRPRTLRDTEEVSHV